MAWITDELDRPDIIDRVLAAQARWNLLGTPIGVVAFGGLAWATMLSTAMVVAGVAMIGLGIVVVARWPETRFAPVDAGSRRLAGLRGDRTVRDICREYEIAETLYYQWRDRMLERALGRKTYELEVAGELSRDWM